jgi:hypothetical protein
MPSALWIPGNLQQVHFLKGRIATTTFFLILSRGSFLKLFTPQIVLDDAGRIAEVTLIFSTKKQLQGLKNFLEKNYPRGFDGQAKIRKRA